MGNTCAKHSEVVDGRTTAGTHTASRNHQKKMPSPDKASNTTSTPTPPPSPPPEPRAPPPTTTPYVVKDLVALHHLLKPSSPVVNPALFHKEFRQFSRIFAQRKAALSVVSCAGAGHPLHVLAGGEDRNMAMLNYETGHVMRRWVNAHQNDINCITTPSDACLFATASRDKTVKVWDFTSDHAVAEMKGHTLNVSTVDMSRDGSLVVSGSKDNTVRLWNTETAEELYCGDVKLNIVHFVKFLPGMSCIAQGGEDLALRLWDVRSQSTGTDLQLAKTIERMDYYPVCCEVMSDDGNVLLTGHNGVNGCGSYVAEWDLRMGKRVTTFTGHTSTVTCVKRAASSVYGSGAFLSSSDDGTMGVWNMEDAEGMLEVHLPVEHRFRTPEGRVTNFTAEDNGDTVLALDDGCLAVLRPGTMDDALVPSLRLRYVGAAGANR